MKGQDSSAAVSIELTQVACLGDQKYPSFELRVILAFLKQQGFASWCEQLLSELSLSETDLEQPFISAHQALEALKRVSEKFYRPGLGHDIANIYTIRDLGELGTCVSHAKDLSEAMAISNAFYDLIGSFNDLVNIADESHYTQRLVNVAKIDPKVMRLLFELTVSGCMVLAKELTGKGIPLVAVRFEEHLSDQEMALYQSLYQAKIEDQAPFNEWTVSQASLSAPIERGQHDAVESEADLKRLFALLNQNQGLVDDIDCILKGSAGDFPDPDMISHAMGMSSRTLRRRLSKIGTSYSALIDKVRCQLALNLIQNKNLCNEAIASELGYSDAANFCNAFKKWTGKVPSDYRIKKARL